MKPCIRCGEQKPLPDYYKHPMMADGHLNKCKPCCREQARVRHYEKMEDPEWQAAERARGREKFGRNRDRWNVGNTPVEVKRAEQLALYHVRNVPDGFERHHWSYLPEDALDVTLLPIGDHRAAHRRMTYDPRHLQFRTPRGHLLDTKPKHLRWLRAVLAVREQYRKAA